MTTTTKPDDLSIREGCTRGAQRVPFLVCRDRSVLAEVFATNSDPTGENTARLFAAAPDLLAALVALREAVTDVYKAGHIPAEPFVAAGNVIAKAEGR